MSKQSTTINNLDSDKFVTVICPDGGGINERQLLDAFTGGAGDDQPFGIFTEPVRPV
jgi:hypothetical protein